MNTASIHHELIVKRKKLEEITVSLKDRFFGLDSVIEEVISLMMPWYLFPEAQRRPTVINLWGLTGSGKTALVQAIVELLDHKRFYVHMDMGEFESDSALWIKNILTDDLEFFHQKPVVVCLDEFQFARTLDGDGDELAKDKLRVIWDLLDSGRIDYTPGHGTSYLFRADNCLKRLEKAIRSGVAIQNGEVVSALGSFLEIFESFYFDHHTRYNEPISKSYFVSRDFIEGMVELIENDEFSKEYILERVKASSLQELKAFVLQAMRLRPATKELDLSCALIFVLGNLDEAYTMSHSMNPDISADDFHEATSKITIANIKRALRKRFRPEQIARLGNNHVIYRSFNNAHFRQLIERELNGIAVFVLEKFGWTVNFDASVVDVVYGEGVFPSQGTRPVFTTIKNLIESRISKLVVSVLEDRIEASTISWKFDNGRFVYHIKNNAQEVIKIIFDEASLKLENLRKSIDPEIQAYIAVHEAGHAVLAALTLQIVPSLVVSRTASDVAEGFCLINFPKGPVTRETLKKDIVITLGGYVAEKMIFGEEHTSSGVYGDIEEASSLANRAIRKYAMGTEPIHLAVESSQNEDAFFHSDMYAAEAITLIKTCEAEAASILQRNKLLLLKMAEYLTSHSRMEESLIAEYVRMYSVEEWVHRSGFTRKENYFQFNRILQEQLKALEEAGELSIKELLEDELV
jgi:hypothetical protein